MTKKAFIFSFYVVSVRNAEEYTGQPMLGLIS